MQNTVIIGLVRNGLVDLHINPAMPSVRSTHRPICKTGIKANERKLNFE